MPATQEFGYFYIEHQHHYPSALFLTLEAAENSAEMSTQNCGVSFYRATKLTNSSKLHIAYIGSWTKEDRT